MNEKQTLFKEFYLATGNATESAVRAGYSPNSAHAQGHRLLKNAEIARAIAERTATVAMDADEVLQRLARQARGTMEDFVEIGEDDAARISLAQAARRGRLDLVKKLRTTTKVTTLPAKREGETPTTIREETLELELYDSQSALALLGKNHKLFAERLEVDWRGELEAAGLNPDAELEQLTTEFTRYLSARAYGAEAGGGGAGTPADRIGAEGSGEGL